MTEPTAYFISDVHLQENAPILSRSFVDFCASLESKQIHLYILGDLFDAWLGDEQMPQWQNIVDALQAVSKGGCSLFLQHGNRDFLIGEEFLTYTGCSLIEGECLITLHGKKALLDHGEIFCSNDPGSLRARAKTRSHDFKQRVLKLSLEQRRELRDQLFSASDKHKQQQSQGSMRVSQSEILRYLEKTECDVLIYGHTHIKEDRQEVVKGRKRHVLNTGRWQSNGEFSYITLDQAGIKMRHSRSLNEAQKSISGQ